MGVLAWVILVMSGLLGAWTSFDYFFNPIHRALYRVFRAPVADWMLAVLLPLALIGCFSTLAVLLVLNLSITGAALLFSGIALHCSFVAYLRLQRYSTLFDRPFSVDENPNRLPMLVALATFLVVVAVALFWQWYYLLALPVLFIGYDRIAYACANRRMCREREKAKADEQGDDLDDDDDDEGLDDEDLEDDDLEDDDLEDEDLEGNDDVFDGESAENEQRPVHSDALRTPRPNPSAGGPPEVAAALQELTEAAQGFSPPAFKLVADRVRAKIVTYPDLFAEVIRKGNPVRRWVWGAIANEAGNLVESGEFHIYRGASSPMGPGDDLVRIFDKATEELVRLNAVSPEFAAQQRKNLRENIKTVG